MVYIFIDKKSSGGTVTHAQSKWDISSIKSKIMSNKQVAKELHKVIIRNFQKQNSHNLFGDFVLGKSFFELVKLTKNANPD